MDQLSATDRVIFAYTYALSNLDRATRDRDLLVRRLDEANAEVEQLLAVMQEARTNMLTAVKAEG